MNVQVTDRWLDMAKGVNLLLARRAWWGAMRIFVLVAVPLASVELYLLWKVFGGK